MQREEQLRIAKLSSIIGGAFLLGGAVITALGLLAFLAGAAAFFGDTGAPFVAFIVAFALFVLTAGLVTGAIVLLGAFRFEGPQRNGWALATLVSGIVALITGGGFFIGAVAAIIGGVLAMSVPDE